MNNNLQAQCSHALKQTPDWSAWAISHNLKHLSESLNQGTVCLVVHQ